MFLKRYSNEWWQYLSGASKYQGLDMLRAVAIVAVLLWHHYSTLFRAGWIGVNLFFILSGFLIGTILLKGFDARRFSYWDYLSNRLLRIYPLYAVAILLYLAQMYSMGFVTDWRKLGVMAALQATFLQTLSYDIWGVEPLYYNVTWSLVVEMVFYVTIPVILFVLHKLKLVWPGLLALAAAFLWFRFSLIAPLNPVDPNWHFFFLLRPYFRYDELLYGVAVAYAVHTGFHAFRQVFLVVGLVGLAVMCQQIWAIPKADQLPSMALLTWQSAVVPTFLAAVFASIVYAIYDKPWSCAPINIVARLAYPLYLFHTLVVPFSSGWVSFLSLSFVAAILASYLIEYPFIRMYKKSDKRRPLPGAIGLRQT